ncbi:extracellular ribonuclease LE-like [Carex rostrata]
MRITSSAFGILLLLVFLSSAQAGYDFFYFVLQWPGSNCDTSSGCCYPSYGKPPSNFGIHGLWPNYNNSSYPANCDPNNPFNISQIQDLVTSLRTNWPSLACPSIDSTSYWQHEWNKHGTCSESVMNQHAYFQVNLNLKSRIKLLQYLQSAGITPNNEFYSLTNIKTAIKAGVGHTPWIQCNKNAAGTYQLYQVYICIDHSGTVLIDCPVYPTRGGCSTSSIQFPSFVGQHGKTSPLETTFNEKGSIEK